MQLKCFVTSSLCHLLFGNNLLTSPWLRHQALSSGPGRAAELPSPLLRAAAAARSWAPSLQHLEPPQPQGPPSARVPSCLSPAQSLNGSLRSFSAALLPGHHLCCTTDLPETHHTDSVVPARHRQQFSAEKRRQGGSKEPPFLWTGLNTPMLNK